jgi:3-deoxy-D-manno-octulosonic-acid transferase
VSIWQNLYRFGTDAGAPVIDALLRQRLRRGKEDAARIQERRGIASLLRPQGRLIWCHAASVGEMMSVLLLIEKLGEHLPTTHFLLTTGTVTSAQMVASRLPPRTLHQFVPVDRAAWVRRFFDHWRPDAALWLESELWPNLLAALRARKIPAAMVNARVSAGSKRRWQYMRSWIAEILGTFQLCLTQTVAAQEDFRALGALRTEHIGNLKYASQPLQHDVVQLEKLKQQIGARPCWLMASTHPGEEGMALATHQALLQTYPDLMTVIVPRHPARGDGITAMLVQHGVQIARRSLQQTITPATGIYLADTLGELGLFFRLCPVVCMGGSFSPVGGHNPIEPAWLGCAIVYGPDTSKISEVIQQLLQAGALLQVYDGAAMQQAIGRLLGDKMARDHMAQAARRVAENHHHVLDKTVAALLPVLSGTDKPS